MEIMLIPTGTKVRPGTKLSSFEGVTVHMTDNPSPGANALQHYKYLMNRLNLISNGFHYCADDTQVLQFIPDDERTAHSGSLAGNRTTVGIEICVNSDGNLILACNNAAEAVAEILLAKGHTSAVWKQNIFQHADWASKNCPSLMRRGIPYSWMEFVARVNAFMQKTKMPAKIPSLGRLLRYYVIHMRGADVKQLQERLIAKGFDCGATDGIFGKITRAAVLAFQAANKLKIDGIVGSATWAKLFS